MTIRDRIADWISGGKLTEARDGLAEQRLLVIKYRAGGDFDRRMCARATMAASKAGIALMDARDDLSRIAALETPGANATVRKMARIAREALGE